MIEDKRAFVQFLIAAKRATYAGSGELEPPSRPGSKDLGYRAGEYAYLDSYLGDREFVGEEAVWAEGQPVWGMNYYGRLLVEAEPEGFGKFLKKALRQAPQEAPFRGPSSLQEGRFEYRCNWVGELFWFDGKEEIYLDGNKIYELMFHGGTVEGRG